MGRMIVGLVAALCAGAVYALGFIAGMLHMRRNYREELRQARRMTRAALRHESIE